MAQVGRAGRRQRKIQCLDDILDRRVKLHGINFAGSALQFADDMVRNRCEPFPVVSASVPFDPGTSRADLLCDGPEYGSVRPDGYGQLPVLGCSDGKGVLCVAGNLSDSFDFKSGIIRRRNSGQKYTDTDF